MSSPQLLALPPHAARTQSLTVPHIFFVLPIPWRLFVPRMPYLNPLDRTDWTTRFTRSSPLALRFPTCGQPAIRAGAAR